MKSKTRLFICIALFTFHFSLFTSLALAQSAQTLDTLKQEQPAFFVRASVDKPDGLYFEGDHLQLSVRSSVDAYLYIVYQQADGKCFRIFPNSSQPSNRVQAGKAVTIPGPTDVFQWSVTAPYGKETINVIASKTPITKVMAEAAGDQIFNALSDEQVKGLRLEVVEQDPATWATHKISITTAAQTTRLTSPPKVKRFGVFFGVSHFEFNKEFGGGLDLTFPDSDARSASKAFKDYGQMTDVRLLTNEKATRANLNDALTSWLPSVTQPGDLVVIYWSGHGGQIPDDNGDEPDGLDEFLVTHDCMPYAVWQTLGEQVSSGKLDPQLVARVQAASKLVAQYPGRASEMLIRSTAVTDDLFGNWLQSLDGRQVVVVLDICHSGGFATDEKSLDRPAASDKFDFLEGEAEQLKDIGQPNQAIMAACRRAEEALEGLEASAGEMTFHLLQSLGQSSGPLDLQQLFDQTSAGMQRYFDSDAFQQINARRQAAGRQPIKPHHAYLVNYCAPLPLLKP